jgi:hypothetical protein
MSGFDRGRSDEAIYAPVRKSVTRRAKTNRSFSPSSRTARADTSPVADSDLRPEHRRLRSLWRRSSASGNSWAAPEELARVPQDIVADYQPYCALTAHFLPALRRRKVRLAKAGFLLL